MGAANLELREANCFLFGSSRTGSPVRTAGPNYAYCRDMAMRTASSGETR